MNKLCHFFKRKEQKLCFYCNYSVISILTIGTDQKITYILKQGLVCPSNQNLSQIQHCSNLNIQILSKQNPFLSLLSLKIKYLLNSTLFLNQH